MATINKRKVSGEGMTELFWGLFFLSIFLISLTAQA